MYESSAISRYAAKCAGLYPSDPMLALQCDELMDISSDVLNGCPGGDTPELKAAARKAYGEGKMKVLMDVLAQRLEENGGVWCSGPELTIGDLFVNFMVVGQIKAGDFDHIDPSYMDAWPTLLAFHERVKNHDVVKAYYASKS